MFNQRVLPACFEYRSFNSTIEMAEGISSMVVRGAPVIGCASSAYGVALEAQRL
jgi:methylthioribose-1-phosphate isomerase